MIFCRLLNISIIKIIYQLKENRLKKEEKIVKKSDSLAKSNSREVSLVSFIKKSLIEGKADNLVEVSVDENFSEFDHLLIASGSSNRQVVSLAEKILEEVKKSYKINGKIEGKENADWILLDFYSVIVHIFRPEVREYYQIEKIWKSSLVKKSN